MLLLDARNFEDLARAVLGHHTPLGLDGLFITENKQYIIEQTTNYQ